MAQLTIAFLYNVRHDNPDANDPATQLEADFDDPKTTQLQIKTIESLGYKVIPIEADDQAYFKLYEHRKEIDLAFNVSEGYFGADREAQIPAMLEMLQIPYTGSTPLTQALRLNKAKAKEVLKTNNIPVADHQVFAIENDTLNPSLKFPLIVKPLSQGTSAGITNKSVVNNENELHDQAKWVIDAFHQPVLVETFLPGREFSVPMIGNPPKFLPIIEPNHDLLPKDYLPIDSLEVKWVFEEQSEVGAKNYLVCPATIDNELHNKIEKICLQSWNALNIRDWCRVDIRCDKDNSPFVLEVNSPPGITPPEISLTSYLPYSARKAGIEYPQLLQMIIETALKRYEK